MIWNDATVWLSYLFDIKKMHEIYTGYLKVKGYGSFDSISVTGVRTVELELSRCQPGESVTRGNGNQISKYKMTAQPILYSKVPNQLTKSS